MTRRRKPGDWVRLRAGAGGCGESRRLPAEIQAGEPVPCPLCDDYHCDEWPTLWTAPDPLAHDRRHVLYHVSECEMEDCDDTQDE